jgi:CheY-like chemotaxis protein
MAMIIPSALHGSSPQSHSLGSDAVTPDPATLKILLAEDNLTNQKVALKQLQSLGYRADVAINGRQAVEAIARSADNTYNLVLMDCQMPELDGYEATQVIRAWEAQSRPKQQNQVVIVAMTASDLEADRQQAIAAGMNDFITKPVRRETLAALLLYWNQLIHAKVYAGSTALSHQAELSQSALPPIDSDFFRIHLDLNHLHVLSDNSLEFERELLQLFTEDSWAHLALLRQAIEIQDLRRIEQIAHHLKGSSANVGARAMQSAADQLEAQAHGCHSHLAEALVIQLHRSLQQIQHYLDRQLEEASSSP